MNLTIRNNNPQPRTIQKYDGKFVTIPEGSSITVEYTTLVDYNYYKSLIRQNFTVTKSLVPYNDNHAVKPSITTESIQSTTTKSEDQSTADITPDQVLDKAVDELLNDNSDDSIGFVTEEPTDERTLDQLESWEYKAILTKLGVTTRATSINTLRSLVESNLDSTHDWRSMIKGE